MINPTTHAVTGAFSYTGKYITQRLLARGHQVITLTSNPDRPNPHSKPVPSYPFNFNNFGKLVDSLRGIDTLFNTYWVRFDYGDKTFRQAVSNTEILFKAAQEAGVRRIVHVSIANPSLTSQLPYFQGKAHLESKLQHSGVSFAILRPTVIFGPEDILINNIAYLLRRFPLFAIPGDGSYPLQPIFVEDMADLAVQAGQLEADLTWDAVGPEIYCFEEMVKCIQAVVGTRNQLMHLPPRVALTLSRLVGLFVKDVILTQDEVEGLMAGLLVSDDAPRGQKSLRGWLQENRETVGRRYASELARHYQS